ncbi:MAG TPA: RnfABCDGE type electron transport complex subunit D [Actinobacteria bacterium]|nr:RnfABCDGE type electron transport complex subunit D [Actinomycetota bacterium]
MNNEKLTISPAPHMATEESVPRIMYAVIYSLIPAGLAAGDFFGLRAIALIAICIVTSMATEYVFQKLRAKPASFLDGSAIITGLLLAYTLPSSIPFYMAIIGVVVAVVIGKQIFGGLGHNIFNPALVGRAFLVATFPVAMATWTLPGRGFGRMADALTGATPLSLMKFDSQATAISKMFFGGIGGSLGETSALALLAGAAYLYYKGYIEWRIPLGFIGTTAAISTVLWLVDPSRYPNPVFSVLAGGLILGAFFMATDYVTSPITPLGKLIFGIGGGSLVIIIRFWGGMQEGVMYAILLMNAVTPLINLYTKPKPFGSVR